MVLDTYINIASIQVGLNYLRESVGANIRDEYPHVPLKKYKCDWSENQKRLVRYNIRVM